MATVGSTPPRKGQSKTGKVGRTGAWLLMLAVMAVIAIAVAITAAQLDRDPAAEPADPIGAPLNAAGALAQQPSPTAAPETPAPIESPAAVAGTTNEVASETLSQLAPPTPPVTSSPPALAATAASMEDLTSATDPMATIMATPWPMPTPREAYSWTLEVPILMYHYISHPPADADQYRLDLSTAPELFREQLQYLLDNGYETVDLYDLTLAIVDRIQLPDKPIVLSFDDGYRDNYENAFPILKELGMKGTFFVTTDFIDQNNPNYMDWAMIEEMAAAGMRIEPHSKTHPDLTLHDRAFVIWQVLGSQETIASHIGYRPRYFAYPGGRYDDNVLQILAELDFWGAVTTTNGSWHGFDDRFEWGRVRMRNTTSPAELGLMIN